MTLKENISLALRAIQANRLRSIITITIIAIGLTALIGILTAIDALESSINSNFTTLGANSFSIRNFNEMSDGDEKPKPPISYKEASNFKDKYEYPGSYVSISSIFIQGSGTVKQAAKKTNPNVDVYGVDENFISVVGYKIEQGRGFSVQELESASRVVVLGSDVAKKVFTEKDNPIDKPISINNQYYRVIGILEPKGSSFMQSDTRVLIPLTSARSVFPKSGADNYIITVGVSNAQDMEPAIGDATGLLRQVRKLKIGEEDDFNVSKSDSVVSVMLDSLSYVAIGAMFIGFITLIGAAIGLMNIMLVQVNERTREIGVSMAISANRTTIRRQFLIESIVICILGGICGIILGIFIGNMVALALNANFILPWLWIFIGLIVCVITGIAAGYIPARRASMMDPIEALRYE